MTPKIVYPSVRSNSRVVRVNALGYPAGFAPRWATAERAGKAGKALILIDLARVTRGRVNVGV
jgi:hypothetical protein